MARINLVRESFRYHLVLMQAFGLQPLESYPRLYLPYALFLYVIFTTPTPLLAIFNLIKSDISPIDAITENGFMIVELSCLIPKFLPCIFYPEDLRNVLFGLNKNIFNSQLPEQDHILKETVDNCRLIFQLFSTSSFLAVMTWAILPLFYDVRRFPIAVWLPFDGFGNTLVYVTVYIYVCVCVTNGAFNNCCLDTLVSSQIYHAASQIRVLKDTLTHLDQRAEDQVYQEARTIGPEERELLKADIIYKKICHCVDHYNAIYQFVENLENSFSIVVFSQLLASIIIICICCLQLSVAVPFTIPFFGALSFLAAILLQLFLYCYSGTLLFEESDTIVTAIYMSDWYNFDKKSKKALITLMERAKRPMRVTAAKLLEFSLETFTTVIRRSYSLLAVLKNY